MNGTWGRKETHLPIYMNNLFSSLGVPLRMCSFLTPYTPPPVPLIPIPSSCILVPAFIAKIDQDGIENHPNHLTTSFCL